MKKLCLLTALCALMLACAGLAAAEDPLFIGMEVTPHVLPDAATVRVEIEIKNEAQEPLAISLRNPDDEICKGFGQAGEAELLSGQSISYQDSWFVTPAQLQAERLVYTLHYTLLDETGTAMEVTRPISRRITRSNAQNAENDSTLQVAQTTSGELHIAVGDTVDFHYELVNTSDEVIRHLQIDDPLLPYPAVHGPLLPGGKTEITYRYTAGEGVALSEPRLSYQHGDTIAAQERALLPTQVLTEAGLTITLDADEDLVDKGDSLLLHYTITNTSEQAYRDLTLTDAVLMEVDHGLDLAPHATYEGHLSVTMQHDTTFRFTASGINADGHPVSIPSNGCTILVTENTVQEE